MNQVNILGNIGRIERKGAVLKFSVATNRVSKGEKVTDWHNMVSFGDTASNIEKYFAKGDSIAITGKLQYGSYEKDGQTRYTTDIVVDRWYFTGKKSAPSTMDTFISNKLTKRDTVDEDEIPF
jgi:single-strand DNA-binding protein